MDQKLFEFVEHIGKYRVLVQTRDIQNGAVKTAKIADGAVTADKIGDGEVKNRNIASKAVTRDKIDDNAITELLGLMDEFTNAVRNEISEQTPVTIRGNVVNAQDEEDLTAVEGLLKLKDRSGLYGYAMKILRRNKTFAEQVTQTRCIYMVQYDFNLGGRTIDMPADSIVMFTGGKLINGTLVGNKRNGIGNDAEGDYGLLLCSALYYDYLTDITLGGEYMDETAKNIQSQINAIVNDKAQVSLTASPSPVFVGVQSNISLAATTNTQATSIKIMKGSTEIASGSGMSLNGSDTITPSAAGSTTYLADFTIAGLHKQATKNVVAVYPIKYGAGQAYTDAQNQASARTTPAGTYNVVVAQNEDYVFFVVPRTMNISSAEMSGFDFPLQAPVNVEIDGVEYKYYQSSNTYDAGTLTIVIS